MTTTTSAVYETVDLLDMKMNMEDELFTYACPCGDLFFITVEDLLDNEDRAKCPSCSLILQVNYDPDELDKILEKFE